MIVTVPELEIPIASLSYVGEVVGSDELVAILIEPDFEVDEEGVAGFESAAKLIYQIRDLPAAQTLSISENVRWNEIPDILIDLIHDAFEEWKSTYRLDYLEQVGG